MSKPNQTIRRRRRRRPFPLSVTGWFFFFFSLSLSLFLCYFPSSKDFIYILIINFNFLHLAEFIQFHSILQNFEWYNFRVSLIFCCGSSRYFWNNNKMVWEIENSGNCELGFGFSLQILVSFGFDSILHSTSSVTTVISGFGSLTLLEELGIPYSWPYLNFCFCF